jgi:hypothetical protein
MRIKAGSIEQQAIHEIGARVLIDGKPLAYCVEADDGAGWAIVADTDDQGNIKVNRQRSEVIERKVFGSIRFQLNSDHACYSAQGRRWLSGRRPK